MSVDLDESQRQLLLLALAELSIERPGLDYACNALALKMDNNIAGRAQLYDEFRTLHGEVKA